jgi:predicted nucleic acid-binding protein
MTMLSIYLDTNIYIFGLLDGKSSSALLLREILERDIMIVQSDYLFDEVLHWFRERKGKDSVGLVRTYLLTIPNREFINKAEWSYFLDKVKDEVADKDDLPHICSYFAGSADYFVTANRRLTQMKIRDKVKFLSPDDFLVRIGTLIDEKPDDK